MNASVSLFCWRHNLSTFCLQAACTSSSLLISQPIQDLITGCCLAAFKDILTAFGFVGVTVIVVVMLVLKVVWRRMILGRKPGLFFFRDFTFRCCRHHFDACFQSTLFSNFVFCSSTIHTTPTNFAVRQNRAVFLNTRSNECRFPC